MKKMIFIVICLALSGCAGKRLPPPPGYTSSNASATSNVFLLNKVTSEFSVGNIVTIGDSKKEHEILSVTALNKSESGNSQSIILMDGVGFVVKKGWKVSVVKETDVEEPVRIDYSNGSVYVGEIVSGKPHGQGTRTFTNGDKYVGEWKNGKENGNGKRNSPDGRNYVGEWKDGREHGQGTFTFPNGKKYVGEWKEGRKDGQGTDIFPDGSKGIGEFREGRPWNITHRDKNGNIIVKFVNGKEIRP